MKLNAGRRRVVATMVIALGLIVGVAIAAKWLFSLSAERHLQLGSPPIIKLFAVVMLAAIYFAARKHLLRGANETAEAVLLTPAITTNMTDSVCKFCIRREVDFPNARGSVPPYFVLLDGTSVAKLYMGESKMIMTNAGSHVIRVTETGRDNGGGSMPVRIHLNPGTIGPTLSVRCSVGNSLKIVFIFWYLLFRRYRWLELRST